MEGLQVTEKKTPTRRFPLLGRQKRSSSHNNQLSVSNRFLD